MGVQFSPPASELVFENKHVWPSGFRHVVATHGRSVRFRWRALSTKRRSGGTGIRTELKTPHPCGFDSHLRHLTRASKARLRLIISACWERYPGPQPKYGALGKRLSRNSFKVEIAGSNPARPIEYCSLKAWVCGLTGEGSGLLSREMWVRLPPDPSVVCSHSSIGESGAGITCQHQIGARSGFESWWEH